MNDNQQQEQFDNISGDSWIEVQYLRIQGGSGSTRMHLHQVPQWLFLNQGAMIIGFSILR